MEGEVRGWRPVDFRRDFTCLRTQYDYRDLCIMDLLNAGCSKGHALERWMQASRH